MKSQHADLFYYVLAVYGAAAIAMVAFPNAAFMDMTAYTGAIRSSNPVKVSDTQISARNQPSAKIIGASLLASQSKL